VQFARYLGAIVERSLRNPEPGPSVAPRQLILSSHSPAILRALATSDENGIDGAVFLDMATRVARGRPDSRVTRCRVIVGQEHSTGPRRFPQDGDVRVVSPAEIAEFEVTEALHR